MIEGVASTVFLFGRFPQIYAACDGVSGCILRAGEQIGEIQHGAEASGESLTSLSPLKP